MIIFNKLFHHFIVTSTLITVWMAVCGMASAGELDLVISTSGSAIRGTNGLVYQGTLTNNTGHDLTFSNSGDFTIFVTPPAGDANLISFDQFFIPADDPLPSAAGSNTYTGNLFSLNIDPAATPGNYVGGVNVTFSDGTGTDYTSVNPTPDPVTGSEPRFNLGVQASAAPEPSPIATLGLVGLGLAGLMFLARRRKAARETTDD